LFISIILGVRSSHWLILWVAFEINSLCMCFLISKDNKIRNLKEDSTFLYLVTQIFGSLLILSGGLSSFSSLLLLIRGAAIKIGVWPFHLWYIKLIFLLPFNGERLTLIITWQKVIPLIVFVMTPPRDGSQWGVVLLAVVSLIRPIRNIKKNRSIESIIGLSSLNTNGWFILTMIGSLSTFLCFLLMYNISLLIVLNMVKRFKKYGASSIIVFWKPAVVIRNFGGIPPMTIFWAKVIVVKTLLESKIPIEITLILIVLSCLFLYFYLWGPINRILWHPVKTQHPILEKRKEYLLMPIIASSSLIVFLLFMS